MTGYRFSIAIFDDHAALAEALPERIAGAWGAGAAPVFTTRCGNSAEPATFAGDDAVIVIARRATDEASVLMLLSALEEASVPVVALLDEAPAPGNCYAFAGALVELQHGDDRALAATLRALAHRQREVRRLRGEVTLAQRFNGGLEGQMARMHEELQLAAMVQREFLPRDLPSLHGMHFAALWRPAHYVSGDLYDVIRLDEDHVGLFVADSIGHGVPAALMTMVICRSLAVKEISGSSYRLVPPAEVLARLNQDMIRRQGRSTRFATAVYALLDCRSRVMQVAGGGHPAPILLRADGSTERVETSGGLIGVFAEERYEQVEVELAVDDRMLIYSDGFEQAFPDAEAGDYTRRLPTTRYLQAFEDLRTAGSATSMVDRMARELDDQSGSLHQVDDLTLLCMVTGELEEAGAVPEAAMGNTR